MDDIIIPTLWYNFVNKELTDNQRSLKIQIDKATLVNLIKLTAITLYCSNRVVMHCSYHFWVV